MSTGWWWQIDVIFNPKCCISFFMIGFFRFIFDICIQILFDVFLPANFFFTGGHQVMRRALCKLPKRRTWKLWVSPSCHPDAYDHPEHTVDAPAKSESPVENGGKHPILYRVSTCFNHPKLLVQDSQPPTVGHDFLGIISSHGKSHRKSTRKVFRKVIYHLVMTNVANWEITMLSIGKSS